MTDENRAAAGGVLRRSGGLVRSSDLDHGDVRIVHVHLVVGNHPAPLQWLGKAFRLPQLPYERHADDARSRLDRHPDLEPGVPAALHVLFPFGIAGKAWLTVARVTGGGRSAVVFASDGEAFQQLAIEADVELLRPAHALEVILILPLETNFDEVLAIDRKVVVNGETATRSERQIVALPVILHHVQWNLESLEPRIGGRETGREPRDLTGHREVSLQVGRRNREDIPKVVETAVR